MRITLPNRQAKRPRSRTRRKRILGRERAGALYQVLQYRLRDADGRLLHTARGVVDTQTPHDLVLPPRLLRLPGTRQDVQSNRGDLLPHE